MGDYIDENNRRKKYKIELQEEMADTNHKIQVQEEKVDSLNYIIQQLEYDKE